MGAVLVLLSYFGSVEGDLHSLEYTYAALSKPVSSPGVYEFTAISLLDNKRIDYYNSQDKRMVPRKEWMEKTFPKSYWDEGTQVRKSEEQWFKDNINILMERMHSKCTDLHVLQWRCGCVGEYQPGGAPVFKKGFNQYGYDGKDFLYLDLMTSKWSSILPQAMAIKRDWQKSNLFNQCNEEYLRKECMNSLYRFMTFGEEDLKNSVPEGFIYAKKSNSPDKLILHCLATGFYPKDVTVEIYRNGVNMTEGDGVKSSKVVPSELGPNGMLKETYQLRKSVEINFDKNDYICKITHRSLKEPVSYKWNGDCHECGRSHIVIGVVFLTFILACGVVYCLCRSGDYPVASLNLSTTLTNDVENEQEVETNGSRTIDPQPRYFVHNGVSMKNENY